MAVDFDKEKIIEYEVKLFKTTPTDIDDDFTFDEILAPFSESQGYTEQNDSNLVMAGYQAILNCSEGADSRYDSITIGDLSTSMLNTKGAEYGCISRVQAILEQYGITIKLNRTIVSSYVSKTSRGCK